MKFKKIAAAVSLTAGLALVGLGLAGGAGAHTPAATASSKCLTASTWEADFVVGNDPSGSYGTATIAGTGTGLDGQKLSASGPNSTAKLSLVEANLIKTVTVKGTLVWNNYSAPFTATATQPTGCVTPPPTVTATATVTVPGPTVTVPGPTSTVTLVVTGPTSTITKTVPGPTTTITEPGPTTTVITPGPTVTLTETQTQTETATATATVSTTATETQEVPGPTISLTAPGTTVTATETVTVTPPTETVTATETKTVVQTVEHTTTATATVTKTEAGATVTRYICPPNAKITSSGNLAYTGSGNTLSLLLSGGAAILMGLVLMRNSRKIARQH